MAEDIVMHCGVGICGACYEVGSEVLAQLTPGRATAATGHVDSRAVLVRQAAELGVREVSVSPWCSAHDRAHFFSHRASGGRDGRGKPGSTGVGPWGRATGSRSRARDSTGRCAGTATGCASSDARCRPRSPVWVACAPASWRCPTRRRWCSSPRARRRGPCPWPGSATRGWQWTGDEEPMTTNTSDVVSAIRELTNTKQLERSELLDLLKDGLHAALVKRYGPNVRSEIGIDELKGTIRVVVLR